MIVKYLFPYSYGFSTRTKTIFYKLSFFIVVVFPILSTVLFLDNDEKYLFLKFFIGFTAMYCTYEIGYIANDTHTVRFEKKPTHRLDSEKMFLIDRWSNILMSVRVVWITMCIILLQLLDTRNIMMFIVMLMLLNFSYSLHNSFRSRFNIVTIFLVVALKYCSVPILFIDLKHYSFYLLILVAIVPLLRTIEFAAKSSYQIRFFEKLNPDSFRVFYYFFGSLIFLFAYFSKGFPFSLPLFLFLSFFVFRIFCYVAIRSSKIKAAREFNSKIQSKS